MTEKKTVHLGTVREREVEGLTQEDKEKIMKKLGREAYMRAHCNGARVMLPRVEEEKG